MINRVKIYPMNSRLASIATLVFLLVSTFYVANAQNADSIAKPNISWQGLEKIYSTFDEPPIPPGGEQGYRKFLSEHIRYPMAAYNANASGTVYISITVDKDGTL